MVTLAPGYFMLGTNDGEDFQGRVILAEVLSKSWLSRAAWPVYSSNKYRKAFAVGDQLLFYVGGRHRSAQSFIASARTSAISRPTREEAALSEDFLMGHPEKTLALEDINLFRDAISIRPLIGTLSVVNRPGPKWGAGLVGGNRRLLPDDYRLVTHLAVGRS